MKRGHDMKNFEKLGFYPADILLPKDADMEKWAVVACDQFTSQPEYWEAVDKTRQLRPDIILLDVMLPSLDGWGVCKEIRRRSDVPMTMLLSHSARKR